MLERLPRAHASPWSSNPIVEDLSGGVVSGGHIDTENAIAIPTSTTQEDLTEVKRGRSPFSAHQLHALGSSALSASPNTASSASGTSDQDWRRSLHADFDPIHKESGRSSSREASGKRVSPPTTGALPIQVASNTNRPSVQSKRLSFPAGAINPDNAAFVDSSPSSNSSFSHRAASTLSDPHKVWGSEIGSPTGRSGRLTSMKVSSTTESDDLATAHDLHRPARTPWHDPSTRRSLSNSGMSTDRDQIRPLGAQRALSINTSSIYGQGGVFGHNFSPSSLRSSSPDNFNAANTAGNGNVNTHSSPRHGLGRLPEGEEASESTGSFFTPMNAQTFLPAHYGGSSRMRSSSSAAALQGTGGNGGGVGSMFDRTTYGGPPIFDHTARSASVWSNVPTTADVMGSSPGSFSYAHGSSARPASLSRFASDIVLSPGERGRARDLFSAQQGSHTSNTALSDIFAQSAQAENFARAHEGMVRSGSESRRHSLAAPPPLAGQRRAIGFEVSSPAVGMRATSVGRFAGNSGSLAFSDEDLASGLDGLRIQPSNNPNSAPHGGVHAASMPHGYQSFGFSPSDRSDKGWPAHPQHSADVASAALWNNEGRDDGNARNVDQPAHPNTMNAPVPAPLSDQAIASLATLGPLAPPSGGPAPHESASNLQDLGKGVPLQMLARDTKLYIVEFKQGRTDLYFRQSQPGTSTVQDADEIRKGDLVIVEADRGKDLGSVINDSITVEQVQTFLHQQAELAQLSAAGNRPDGVHPAAATLTRLTRSVNPKRLFAKAGPGDTNLLHAKTQDEERALTLCSTKVNQRGLPMAVVAAEMQWDRRKLTFYYTATQRVDFRDLVKELFRLYKTRIWMCHLSHPASNTSGTAASSSSANVNAATASQPSLRNPQHS